MQLLYITCYDVLHVSEQNACKYNSMYQYSLQGNFSTVEFLGDGTVYQITFTVVKVSVVTVLAFVCLRP